MSSNPWYNDLPTIQVKVTFDDGDSMITTVRNTLENARAYYVNNRFSRWVGGEVGEVSRTAIACELA